MMNVLHVVASLNPAQGGVCAAIRGAVPELAKLGVHSEVLCLDEAGAAFLGQDAFAVHALAPGRGPWRYSSRLIPWLLGQLPRFEAVLVHGLWLYPSYAVGAALRQLARRPPGGAGPAPPARLPRLYIMPHGMLDPYFQRAAGRKLKAIRNSLYWKLLEEKVVHQAAAVLFTCEQERRLARTPFRPYHPQQEINVGFGIARPPALSPAMQQAFGDRCPALGARPYLLFLGRLDGKKGVDLLLEAYAALVGTTAEKADFWAGPPPAAGAAELPALVVAGPGLDTPFGRQLRALAAQLPGLAERVFFPGMLSGDAKWGAFYGCAAFVLPSHQENFGIAVAEALACGKPALISNQVNIWREIKAAGGGLVADDTLAGTQWLLTTWLRLTPPQRQAMGQRSQRAYAEHFAVGPAARKLCAALQEAAQ